jgi:hypothetical protein
MTTILYHHSSYIGAPRRISAGSLSLIRDPIWKDLVQCSGSNWIFFSKNWSFPIHVDWSIENKLCFFILINPSKAYGLKRISMCINKPYLRGLKQQMIDMKPNDAGRAQLATRRASMMTDRRSRSWWRWRACGCWSGCWWRLDVVAPRSWLLVFSRHT